MEGIIMFHGADCPHCRAMMPLVDKLEKEGKIRIEKKEVWHNEKNAEEMRSHEEDINDACGGDLGLPCFFSNKTNNAICSEVSYKELKEWAAKNS